MIPALPVSTTTRIKTERSTVLAGRSLFLQIIGAINLKPMGLKPEDFDHIDETESLQLPKGSYAFFTQNQSFAIGTVNSSIPEVFEPLSHNNTIHFVSCAAWSSHELLTWILSQTGPAEVTIGVWSMSEVAARKLTDLLDAKVITKLRAVFDYRFKNRHPAAHQLASHAFSEVFTFPMHAKVTVVQNDSWNVVLNCSANYTNNPRPESGIISTHKPTVEFYKSMLTEILNHGDPFK